MTKLNEHINQLLSQKQKAVNNEDYERAKELKAVIDKLQPVATQLESLEEKKLGAVQREDYERAKHFKVQIDLLL